MNHYNNKRYPAPRYNGGFQQSYSGPVPYSPYGTPQGYGHQQFGFPGQSPYGNGGSYQPQMPGYQTNPGQQSAYQNQFFQNPLQPEENTYYQQQGGYNEYPGMTNPYPQGSFMVKPPSSGVGTIMNSFKSQDGSLDFNKMMNTTGQMMNALNQVSSMVKGLGGMFKL
ncbi:YppG family protein [Bacillus sp. AK031]